MIAQFDQQLLSSFYLWFEKELLSSDIAAYESQVSCDFKYFDFPDLDTGSIGYAGEFRQLVADTGISNPITGFSINGTGVSADPDLNGGLYIDYNNGRIIMPSDSGQNLTISGDVAVKEVNTYINRVDDLEMILHSEFKDSDVSNPYFYAKEEDLDKDVYFLPACFISMVNSKNEEFCFGGEEETMNKVRVLVISDDNFVLDAVTSKFRDTARKYISHIPYEDFPYGFESTLKSYPYNYEALETAEASAISSLIDKVSVSKMDSEQIRKKLNRTFSIAFIDFDLLTRRFPRV